MKKKTVLCPKCRTEMVGLSPNGETGFCFSCQETFPIEYDLKAETPMKIFLSYGHLEEDICTRMCRFLSNRGHTVWFDKEKIDHGEDWRERIVAGIESSNGVLACLSKYSTRDPGVCLDELTIAVGIKGNVVKTVLLEEENLVKVPATVSGVQWLDMHDWKRRSQEDPQAYEAWCEENFRIIADVIESRDNAEFIGEITIIKRILGVYINTDRQKYYLTKPFHGRKWLADSIEEWLDDPDGEQVCLLYGAPGVGKSAFAAHYSHYNPRVAASFFCRAGEGSYNSADYVFKSLAYLLACRIPDYRKLLAERMTRVDLSRLQERDLFRFLLEEPLNLSIDGHREPLCVIIDGLDECGTPEKNGLADILGQYAKLLPQWIRFLLIARPVAGVVSPLKKHREIILDAKGKENLQDITQCFAAFFDRKGILPEEQQPLLRLLERKSDGIFLYATLLMDGLERHSVTVEQIGEFPEGLSAILYEWFTWVFPDLREYREQFRLVLGVIHASPEPMPVSELKRLFGWGNNEYRDFYAKTSILLQRGTHPSGEETVTFSHEYIAAWLNSEDNHTYYSYRSDALAFMSDRFREGFLRDMEGITDYEARYLIPFYLTSRGNMESLEVLKKNDEAFYRDIFGQPPLEPIVNSHEYAMRLLELAARTRMETLEANRDLPVYYGIKDLDMSIALILYRATYVYEPIDELKTLHREMDRYISAQGKRIEHLRSLL